MLQVRVALVRAAQRVQQVPAVDHKVLLGLLVLQALKDLLGL